MHIYIFYILVHIAQAVPAMTWIYSLNDFTKKRSRMPQGSELCIVFTSEGMEFSNGEKFKDAWQKERKPRWLDLLDKGMSKIRKEISQVIAKIDGKNAMERWLKLYGKTGGGWRKN